MGNGIGMGGHQSSDMINDEWITPKHITDALGCFDLDPCSPVLPPWKIATEAYNKHDDGLSMNWGVKRVFCNPPYGRLAAPWLERMISHKNGIVLYFARTETKDFFKYIWPHADSILFIEGRLFFHYVDGRKAKANSGAPSVLISYDRNNSQILRNSGISGKFIQLK